ncbi:ATP-binding protein [Candidatus Neptunochlamydia vexilliferae]|uniref:ATPase domain-containing protein n=1 Tax=Candidatus Neptunichlamydia vexilliferae TaxID=1651774 RepID=A0ABS0AZP0_9BACT|nr:ATP-binding protein [Candidatus Neptunochlamydia vexilliferae]MBF5059596.1 hypothetical protein [Candidatus Neptunochlamydia vexilliferae]
MEQEAFVGREEEIKQLRALLKKRSASFVVVKGRRRIGKSRLIEEFSKNRKTYKITGLAPEPNTTKQDQLDEFAKQLSAVTGLPEIKTDDWSKLFAFLAREVKTGQVLVIFDEISWIGSKDSAFLAKLKNAWDDLFKKNPKLIFIVCGSVSTWIDDNILNSKAFYGRISWTLELNPLPLADCNRLLKAHGFRGSTYEKFKLLSVTGGIPWYIELMQGNFNADENIKRQCFLKGGALFGEFEQIFHDVFGKQDQVYKDIVEALADGAAEYKEISKKIDYKSSGRLSNYLTALEKGGFISKDFTWSLASGKESKIAQYRLSDNYLRFYLKYISPHQEKIKKGHYNKGGLPNFINWDTVMGLQFENLVLGNREKILELLSIRPEDIISDNPYLQKQKTRHKGCQVDYLIQTKYKNLYVCEIKFSRSPISAKAVDEMKKKIRALALPRGTSALPVLIHLDGVTHSPEIKDYFYETIDFGELLY